MLLSRLQHELAAVYEAPVSYDVYDFLITDARLADALAPAASNRERLLVQDDADDCRMSLYIDDEILNHLDRDDPLESLHDGNLAEFLVALEGVSHFQYLSWNAARDHAVTPFELELQAEVDKYVAAAKLIDLQRGAGVPRELHEALFESVSYRPGLSRDLRDLYAEANRYAAIFCRALRLRHPCHHGDSGYLNALRRFYRLSRDGKMKYILAA
jgi:hypothetical protein